MWIHLTSPWPVYYKYSGIWSCSWSRSPCTSTLYSVKSKCSYLRCPACASTWSGMVNDMDHLELASARRSPASPSTCWLGRRTWALQDHTISLWCQRGHSICQYRVHILLCGSQGLHRPMKPLRILISCHWAGRSLAPATGAPRTCRSSGSPWLQSLVQRLDQFWRKGCCAYLSLLIFENEISCRLAQESIGL